MDTYISTIFFDYVAFDNMRILSAGQLEQAEQVLPPQMQLAMDLRNVPEKTHQEKLHIYFCNKYSHPS